MKVQDGGFALLAVLWVLVILSAIAASLTASASLEARIVVAAQEGLVAERLAVSGLEFASYLESRGLGTAREDLSNLPVSVVETGFQYRLQLPDATVEIFLESDNAKINPWMAPEPLLLNFLSNWTGNRQAAARIVAALEDWRDPDDLPLELGAEATAYAGTGYVPRNGLAGVGDLALIRGIGLDDLRPIVVGEPSGGWSLRDGLEAFLTSSPVGARVNANLAPGRVLEAVPGLAPDIVERALGERAQSSFRDPGDFTRRMGLGDEAPSLEYLRFDRGNTPAVLAIAQAGGARRSARHVYTSTGRVNVITGVRDVQTVLASIERNTYPEFARGRTEPMAAGRVGGGP